VQPSHGGDERGSSIIELMVVLAIMAVIAAVSLPSYVGAHQRAKTQAKIANEQVVEMNLQLEQLTADLDPLVLERTPGAVPNEGQLAQP
jgi:prepilin-type N-terminal cleavage/methylation domain-containing protein